MHIRHIDGNAFTGRLLLEGRTANPNRHDEGGLLEIRCPVTDLRFFGDWLVHLFRFSDSIVNEWNRVENGERIGPRWNRENWALEVQPYLDRIYLHPAQEIPNHPEPHAQNNPERPMINEIKHLLESNLNVILTGAPGTGKTFMAKEVAEQIIAERLTDANAKQRMMDERFKSVQFHPGYDYADFVIGMKPVLVSPEGKEVFKDGGELYTTDNGKPNGNRTPFTGTTTVSFHWKDGIFKTFADAARTAHNEAGDRNPAPKFVFLIDEINRADLSRVFGELFSVLEEGYRYPNGNHSDFVLLPNGERFSIPENLYVIGTMNDIDRSVESMDFALRRRFAWKEVKPEETVDDILSATNADGSRKIDAAFAQTLKNAMNALNFEIAGEEVAGQKPKLDLRLGSEYKLGGAIFARFEKCNGDFERLWKNHIEIILNEYLRGRRERNQLVGKLK